MLKSTQDCAELCRSSRTFGLVQRMKEPGHLHGRAEFVSNYFFLRNSLITIRLAIVVVMQQTIAEISTMNCIVVSFNEEGDENSSSRAVSDVVFD